MTVSGSLSKSGSALSTRRANLDWLRVIGMAVVILVHCARYFDKYGWHVENQYPVPVLTYFVNWAGQWVMPMFMLLGGMASRYALQRRSWQSYLNDRWRRLMIPFIFGVLFLSPPQIYIERITHSQFEGSLWKFLPSYFDGWYGFGGNFAWMGLHLWFLLLLFAFSFLMLPLFWRFRKIQIRLKFPMSSIVLALILLVGSEILVNKFPASIGRRNFGGWSLLTYLLLFVMGYLLAGALNVEHQLRKGWALGLLCGVVASTAGFMIYGFWYEDFGIGSSMLRGLAMWGWLVGLIGASNRWLDRPNRLLKDLAPAVLPAYILHQPIIVLLGFLMLDWSAPVLIKYLGLTSISIALTMLLYEFIIRRTRIFRTLFGMNSPA